MASKTTLKFGPVARFRAIEGDIDILRAAATRHGQTLSAYMRDTVISKALDDLGVDTREQALRKLRRAEIDAADL